MRIISGQYKGLQLNGFNIDGTRPTMDRVKESLFAIIQSNLKNSICLDLFAGSGNLGFEALSNYAKTCYFIDNNKEVIKVLQQNATKIKIGEDAIIINNDSFKALKDFGTKNLKFDLIFLDPPYANNLITKTLRIINEQNLLNENGIIVCEYEREKIIFDNYDIIKERKYGDKFISIIKKHN